MLYLSLQDTGTYFADHIWVVHFGFGPKNNYPGGDFMVYVDDKTGRSRLAGGM